MKTLIKKQIASMVAIIATFFGVTSCVDNKFDFPIEDLYNHGLTANVTIADLKAMYTTSAVEIQQDLIVAGYVSSSDKEGNIFKTLYIQDATGGLPIVIDQNNINNSYREGRKVFIKLKGMYIGAYSGLVQLGLAPAAGETSPSRIPATLVSSYLIKDYDITPVVPEVVRINELTDNLVGKLITINDVQFSAPDNTTYATEAASTNRTIEDENGNTIILRNSNYATFALLPLPTGSGTVTGVLSLFVNSSSRTYQLLINDTTDVAFYNARFSGSGGGGGGTGGGTFASPYDVPSARANQGTAGNTDIKWVRGYIVGAYETGGATNVAVFSATTTEANNVLIAATPDETNISNCIPVQLPAGAIRTAINLNANPSNYKREVILRGTLEVYFSIAGLKNVNGYWWIDTNSGVNPDGGSGGAGNGTETSPYTVADALINQGPQGGPQTWTKGYIVGCIKNGLTTISSASDVFINVTSGWDSPTNVLIADSPNETDYTKCIAVNLPSGKPLRTMVNLFDNPGNYQKMLTVKGVLRTYFGIGGLRDSDGEITSFILDGSGGGGSGTSIFNETLMTQTSFDKFTAYSVSGAEGWRFDAAFSARGAQMSGFVDATQTSNANIDWFISPAIDLSAETSATLTFDHARGPAAVITAGISEGWYKVYVSNNYSSGDPTSATWIELTGVNHGTVGWGTVSSGQLTIPTANLAANCRIAFRYECSSVTSATWQIQNVKIQ